VELPLGLATAHGPAAPVGRAEKCLRARFHAGQQVGAGFHAAPDYDRLAALAIGGREVFGARPEGPGGSLPVYEKLARIAVHAMGFELGRVVRDVIDLVQSKVRRVLCRFSKTLPYPMRSPAVRKGHVDGAFHGREIVWPSGN